MACRSCKAVLDLPSTARSRSIPPCVGVTRTLQAARRAPQQPRRHVHEAAANPAAKNKTVAAKKAADAAGPAPAPPALSPEELTRFRAMRQRGLSSSGAPGLLTKLTDRLGLTGPGTTDGPQTMYTEPKTMDTYKIFGLSKYMLDKFAGEANYHIRNKGAKATDDVTKTEDGEEVGTGGGVWHEDFGLLPTFSTWAHVTMLHLWLMVARLRCMPADAHKLWQDALVDHYFNAAEAKMEVEHRMTSRTIRQRYLKDLFIQWRGAVMAYDEGLVRGDAVLAGAVWRNLFKARHDIDVRTLAAVVSWMRRCLWALDQLSDEELCGAFPDHVFKCTPKTELRFVDRPVAGLDQIYTEAGLGKGKSVSRPENGAVDKAAKR